MTKITFDKPVVIGDLANQITINSLQLKSFSVNLASPKGPPNVLISITLTDPVSGFDEHFVYEDADQTAQFVDSLQRLTLNGKGCIQLFIERLQADGKMPAGTITN